VLARCCPYQFKHLRRFREVARLLLREDRPSFDRKLEDSPISRDEIYVDVKLVLDDRRQTDGVWLVVSGYAVLDGDPQVSPPSASDFFGSVPAALTDRV